MEYKKQGTASITPRLISMLTKPPKWPLLHNEQWKLQYVYLTPDAVQGGAGNILPSNLPPQKYKLYQ